jgi:hypothetical protein
LKDIFRRSQEQREMEISQRTRRLLIQLIFPKAWPPMRILPLEYLRQRSRLLDDSLLQRLPNIHCQMEWQTKNPRGWTNVYTLKWVW